MRYPGGLSPEDVQSIVALKEAALENARSSGIEDKIQEFRAFGTYSDPEVDDMEEEEKREIGAGHIVTFVHRVFASHLPENLVSRLKDAALAADREGNWGVGAFGFRNYSHLNVRCAEIIEYNVSNPGKYKIDGLGVHADSESLLTVAVALQEPDEYEGGDLNFQSQCTNTSTVPRPRMGDVTVWPSWVKHAATPVTKGIRRIFVVEFWEYCTRPEQREGGRPGYDDEEDIIANCMSDSELPPLREES